MLDHTKELIQINTKKFGVKEAFLFEPQKNIYKFIKKNIG